MLIGVGVVVLALQGRTFLASILPGPPIAAGLARELRDRGRIAVVGDRDLARVEAEGAELVEARRVRGLEAALSGTDEEELERVMRREAIGGLMIDLRGQGPRRPQSLRDRLRACEQMSLLSGAYLTPMAALYVRWRGVRLTPELGAIVARAARQIVGGSTLPPMRSFPEPLRRSQNVEVMVMLRQGERPRLWRSARGGSIARALITAASVARERWVDRETAMGGSIDERLPSMSVEVYLLEEDGTLGDRTNGFMERMFGPHHGVAFEDRGSWHYLTPEATVERGRGSVRRAYLELFDDQGYTRESWDRPDLRFYRLVARPVGTSPPVRSAGSLPPSAIVPTTGDGARGVLGVPALDGLDGLDALDALDAP